MYNRYNSKVRYVNWPKKEEQEERCQMLSSNKNHVYVQAWEKKSNSTLQPRLGPDEVHFGLAANTTSQRHIVPSAVNVGTLLDV